MGWIKSLILFDVFLVGEHHKCSEDTGFVHLHKLIFVFHFLLLYLICQVGRYIMESYYGKHESFIDSLFDDFLTQDLPVNICQVLPCDLNTVLSLSILLKIKGEGSHRQLSSTIKFNIKKPIPHVHTHHCKIIIIERLPSGVFADPFELEHLLHRAGKTYWYLLVSFHNLQQMVLLSLCM